MNIMIAADYSPPQSGNFVASVIALGRRLRTKGNTVLFVFPTERKWINWVREEQFDVVITRKKDLEPENQIVCLKKLVENYNIDLIHAHFDIFHHAIVHNRKEIKKVRVIIHDHMDFGVNDSITKQYIYSILHSIQYSVNNVNVISVMERKNNSYVFLKHKWYIPNGLSLERYIDHSMNRQECRESLGVKDTDIVCLLLGWDLMRKGFDIALKAIHESRKKNPNIILGIIGAGRGKPADYAENFIKNKAQSQILWDLGFLTYS